MEEEEEVRWSSFPVAPHLEGAGKEREPVFYRTTAGLLI